MHQETQIFLAVLVVSGVVAAVFKKCDHEKVRNPRRGGVDFVSIYAADGYCLRGYGEMCTLRLHFRLLVLCNAIVLPLSTPKYPTYHFSIHEDMGA